MCSYGPPGDRVLASEQLGKLMISGKNEYSFISINTLRNGSTWIQLGPRYEIVQLYRLIFSAEFHFLQAKPH